MWIAAANKADPLEANFFGFAGLIKGSARQIASFSAGYNAAIRP